MVTVNFLWGGDRFNFLQYIVIKSHLKVGHVPVVWISDIKPRTDYWKEIENKIEIKNANSVYNIEGFLSEGGNKRTAADLWRWYFLYEKGGIWCDSDVIALKHFPNDEWIVCTGEVEPDFLSIAVLKAPSHHEIFRDCIKDIEKEWGNVEIFSKLYLKHFGHTNSTHKDRLFYPYKYTQSQKLITKGDIPKDCYCIHYWAFALENYLKKSSEGFFSKFKIQNKIPYSIDNFDEEWCKRNSKTLLGKIWNWLQEE